MFKIRLFALVGFSVIYGIVEDTKVNAATDYLPIDIRCPRENGGLQDLILRNKHGNLLNIKATYKGRDIVWIEAATSEGDGEYIPLIKPGMPATATDEKHKRLLQGSINRSRHFNYYICQADPEKRERIDEVLRRRRLGIQAD